MTMAELPKAHPFIINHLFSYRFQNKTIPFECIVIVAAMFFFDGGITQLSSKPVSI